MHAGQHHSAPLPGSPRLQPYRAYRPIVLWGHQMDPSGRRPAVCFEGAVEVLVGGPGLRAGLLGDGQVDGVVDVGAPQLPRPFPGAAPDKAGWCHYLRTTNDASTQTGLAWGRAAIGRFSAGVPLLAPR